MTRKPFGGFTLIELLIVVAIIAILAAIAVPNFLEAQTRSKVSRTKADQRTVTLGLEIYYTDNNAYPRSMFWAQSSLWLLTSPVAYLSSLEPARDIFQIDYRTIQPTGAPIETLVGSMIWTSYKYSPTQFGMIEWFDLDPGRNLRINLWSLLSVGPVGGDSWQGWPMPYRITRDRIDGVTNSGTTGGYPFDTALPIDVWLYDPTNGTVSFGAIMRNGGPELHVDARAE